MVESASEFRDVLGAVDDFLVAEADANDYAAVFHSTQHAAGGRVRPAVSAMTVCWRIRPPWDPRRDRTYSSEV
jgi:hypothetical protein